MDLFKDIKILSLEQATVFPYLTYRPALDECRETAAAFGKRRTKS